MSKDINEDDLGQAQIRFVTRQQQFAVPDHPHVVPVTIELSGLNAVVNELLRASNNLSKEVEFDFLINSEFLRSTLLEHIRDRGISIEDVIEVEYIEKHPPPEPQDCLIHDDWVSAVAVCEKWLLIGCYDNSLHLRTVKGKHILSIPGHTGPVKDVAWISHSDNHCIFASVSQDQTARIWNWNMEDNSVSCEFICKGHGRELETVDVEKSTNLMATGGWDKLVKIWSTSIQNENIDSEPVPKKSKSTGYQVRVPELTMQDDNGPISGLVWSNKSEIITCSWDHYIKLWDPELGGSKQKILGNKSFLDIDYSQLNKTIISASVDKIIRLYDPRSTEGAIVKSMFVSHTEGVKCVRWSKTEENLFMSGGYDNNVKLWDSRSPKAPLFELTGHEDKVLCCDWSNPKFMISGGADNTVRIFKSTYASR